MIYTQIFSNVRTGVIDKKHYSSIADKPRDGFRGQSRSPNMVPFHILGMVSC